MFCQELQHRAVKNVYDRKKMIYFAESGTTAYTFQPSMQYRVECSLVDHWESILMMIVARKSGGEVHWDDDVRDDVLDPFCELLGLVDATKLCGTAGEFADAVTWLIATKELPLLRVHVLGAPETIERGPARWCREGPVVFQLATALPDSARAWWYSASELVAEFNRRDATDVTEADVSPLYAPEASVFLAGKNMPRRTAGDTKYLWIPSSTKVKAHSLRDQLDGQITRPDAYSSDESFGRQPLKVWRDWKSKQSSEALASNPPQASATENNAAPSTEAPAVVDNEALIRAIASLVVEPWRCIEASTTEVHFAKLAVVNHVPAVERSARFDIDTEAVFFTVYLGGRQVPYDDKRLLDVKTVTTADEARTALSTAATLVPCPGFVASEMKAESAEDTTVLQRGFGVAVSLAMRYAGTLKRGSQPLRPPNIGALPSRKEGSAKNRTTAPLPGEDDDDFDFDDDDVDCPPPPASTAPLTPIPENKFDAGVRNAVSKSRLSLVLEQRGDGTHVFRAADCRIAGGIKGGRCPRCNNRRSALGRSLARNVETREAGTPHKNAPHAYVAESPGMTKQVLKRNATEIKGLKQKLRRWAEGQRVATGVEIKSVEQHRTLAKAFDGANEAAKKIFPEDSVARAI